MDYVAFINEPAQITEAEEHPEHGHDLETPTPRLTAHDEDGITQPNIEITKEVSEPIGKWQRQGTKTAITTVNKAGEQSQLI
ncbi:hypothetical protein JCM16161A_18880 [Vulcanisaeta sp. JCM 16161]|uniref:hypothetical protein n=1 Tax=Vulcanisaeta sp. JCM 16161 TaxID=1295372 RepID=UPI0006D20A43|nr:hypothetical protein [Vulcanisaeta sp. JCM 16161]